MLVEVLHLVLMPRVLILLAHQMVAAAKYSTRVSVPFPRANVPTMALSIPLLVAIQFVVVVRQASAFDLKFTTTADRITSVSAQRDSYLKHRYIGVGTMKTLMTKSYEYGKVIQELLEDLAAHIARDVYSRLAQAMAYLIVRHTVVVSRAE